MLSYDSDCPVKATLGVIGGKWKWLIYRELYLKGRRRFGELNRGIPEISGKALTETLKELEADGVVSRTVYPEVPPRVEYALTEAGMSLEGVFLAMVEWGNRFRSHEFAFPQAQS